MESPPPQRTRAKGDRAKKKRSRFEPPAGASESIVSIHYKVAVPTCVAEQEEKLRGMESARGKLREQRADRLEAYLAGKPLPSEPAEPPPVAEAGGSEEALDAAAEAKASAAFCIPRAPLAAAARSSFLRAHEVADTLGVSYVLEQADAAARLLASTTTEAAEALRARLGRAKATQLNDELCEEEVVSGGGGASREGAAQLAEEAREAGTKAFLAGRYEVALRAYTRALEAAPGSGALHANRSAALARLERAPEAARACVRSLLSEDKAGGAGSHVSKAAARLIALAVNAEVLAAAESEAKAATEVEPALQPEAAAFASALLKRLRRVQAGREEGKRLFEAGEFNPACAAYTRCLTDADVIPPPLLASLSPALAALCSPSAGVGAALLLANRAACRLAAAAATTDEQGAAQAEAALADALTSLSLSPGYAKAESRREAAVVRLRDVTRDMATQQRDELVETLRAKGVPVPDSFPPMDPHTHPDAQKLPWGRSSCTRCQELSRDAVTCRFAQGHRGGDADADAWRVGGHVRFQRSAALAAKGVSLGAGLAQGAGVGEGEAFESGEIVAFDWRTGMHTVRRDTSGGLLRCRLRNVSQLSYKPPSAPTLTSG